MTSSAVWDGGNSRVILAATGLGAATSTTWFYRRAGASAWSAVRGGTVAVSGGVAIVAYDYEFSADISPMSYYDSATGVVGAVTTSAPTVLDQCWLKFPGFPFLNTRVYPIEVGPVSRTGRSQVYRPVSSSFAYQVQELMTGRSYELKIRTTNAADVKALDAAFATGSPMLVHAQEEQLHAPGMYCVVQDVKIERPRRGVTSVRHLTISVEEIGRPGPDYFGAAGVWNSVPVQYATWTVLSGGPATWFDLVEIQGGAGDVIIG